MVEAGEAFPATVGYLHPFWATVEDLSDSEQFQTFIESKLQILKKTFTVMMSLAKTR